MHEAEGGIEADGPPALLNRLLGTPRSEQHDRPDGPDGCRLGPERRGDPALLQALVDAAHRAEEQRVEHVGARRVRIERQRAPVAAFGAAPVAIPLDLDVPERDVALGQRRVELDGPQRRLTRPRVAVVGPRPAEHAPDHQGVGQPRVPGGEGRIEGDGALEGRNRLAE